MRINKYRSKQTVSKIISNLKIKYSWFALSFLGQKLSKMDINLNVTENITFPLK